MAMMATMMVVIIIMIVTMTVAVRGWESNGGNWKWCVCGNKEIKEAKRGKWKWAVASDKNWRQTEVSLECCVDVVTVVWPKTQFIKANHT